MMTDPVLEADGHTYERRALDGWDAEHKGISPVFLAPMPQLPRVRNETLARALTDYKACPTASGEQPDAWDRHTQSIVSHEPMRRPVRLSDGHDYELKEAVRLVAFGQSPMSGKDFQDIEVLRPNRALQTLSADAHGFAAPDYPSPDLRVGSFMPLAPRPVPPSEETLARIRQYVESLARQRVPLADAALQRALVQGLKQEIAAQAVVLARTADAIVAREQRVLGLPFFFEGTRIMGWSLPRPTEDLLKIGCSQLAELRADADVLRLNGTENRVTVRFIDACETFLLPRHRLAVACGTAGFQASLTGAALLGVAYTTGWMAEHPWRSCAIQGVQHGACLGVFLTRRAGLLAEARVCPSLRAARKPPGIAPRPLWWKAGLGALDKLVHGASLVAMASGAGVVAGMVIPPGYLTPEAEGHRMRMIQATTITAASFVIGDAALWLFKQVMLTYRRPGRAPHQGIG